MKLNFKPSSFTSVYTLLVTLFVSLLITMTLSFEVALLPELKRQRALSIAHLIHSHSFDIEVMRTKSLRDTLANKGAIDDDRDFKQIIVSENLEDTKLFLYSCQKITDTVCTKKGHIGVLSGATFDTFERAHSLLVLKSSYIDRLNFYRVWCLVTLMGLGIIFGMMFFLIRRKHLYFSVRDQKMLSAIVAISKEFKIPNSFEDKNEVDGVILETVAQLQLFLRSLHLQIAQYQEWVSKKSKTPHFNGNIAQIKHDLLGPLREISDSLKHLTHLKNELSENDFEEYVYSLRTSVQTLSRRISSSLRLSENDETRTSEEISRLCIKFLNSRSLPEDFVELHLSPDVDALKWTWGDFESAIFNMLENSKQAGATRVQISGSTHQDQLIIEISDNGTGVSKWVGEQIFAEFVSTKEEGHGFGMASVKSRVESAGGTIELVPHPKGAKFVIQLPIRITRLIRLEEAANESN